MKVRTTCNRDCPDTCGIVATVEDGRIVRIQGDPEHPVTRGFLCYRTSRFLERQYDPERLVTPMIRRDGRHEPVAWDEALDLVARKLLQVREESGGAAILNYRSGGSLGLMKHLIDYFFERFGPVAVKSGNICSGSGDAAQKADFGESDSHDLFDLLHSRTIVLWGKNPFVSNLHLLPLLREAKARGARLIQIDPVRHRGADLCDLVLQPRPGGDVALGLGVIRRLFEQGRVDPTAAEYCDHLPELRALVFSRSDDDWAALADVESRQIREIWACPAGGSPSTSLAGRRSTFLSCAGARVRRARSRNRCSARASSRPAILPSASCGSRTPIPSPCCPSRAPSPTPCARGR
jgi:anaerobic selenocysteine-containing dehydrogenase